ncbi:integrase catalytic domain-containing protein [Trichonephila inaurata madagascariensis]|uniref:Integrase catalytic domain-containing protein n=1 Tax=Trichonephila inaurata madagascariensis TaxID=2747483 RepID=A0A8X6YF74_9ARAC|nr:integrase catalytic domain-containing protein [Trichonephila inaurata madagascariensis]
MYDIKENRTIIRAALTKSANNIEALLSSELSDIKSDEIEVTLEQLSKQFKQLKACVNDDKIIKLRPIVDSNGLIRAKTNAAYRDDTNDFRFLIILPSDYTVVKLLIMNDHIDLLHASTSMLMSHLREKYCIIKARKTVRNYIRPCVKCQRFTSKRCDANPGILPNDRSISDQLRKRFRSENLEQLCHQSVKNRQIKPLKVREIVLSEDVNKKRTFWDLARIEKLIPGRDGQIRLDVIKTANSEFLRTVQRLFHLERDSPVLSVAQLQL